MADEKKVIYQSPTQSQPKSSGSDQRLIHKELSWQAHYGATTFSNLDPVSNSLTEVSEREALLLSHLSLPVLQDLHSPAGTGQQQEPNSSQVSQIPSTHLLTYDRLVNLSKLEAMFQQAIPIRSWRFGHRTFEETLTPVEFKQWLANQLSWEPEILANCDRSKGIAYLGIGIKTPPGRVFRKLWKETDTQRRVIPSFHRFKSLSGDDRSKLKGRSYFNLSEQQFGAIKEQRTLLLPSDGSLIDVRSLHVNHQLHPRVTVTKRDVVFGIKQPVKLPEETIRDLVHREYFSKSTDTNLTDSSRSLPVDDQKSDQVNEDGEEELNAALKNDSNIHMPRLVELVRNHKAQSCEFFFNFGHGLRLLFESNFTKVEPDDLAIEQHLTGDTKQLDPARFLTSMTITKRRGNLIKLDGNGNISQIYKPRSDNKSSKLLEAIGIHMNNNGELVESSRMISGKGVVTLFLQDGTFRLLFPSGRVDISTKGDHFFTITPSGLKYLVEKSGDKKLVETIPSQTALDPETHIRFTSRKDHLSVFRYQDGSRLVIFPDGTRISSDSSRSTFQIEHENHDPVKIDYDYFRARNPSMIGPSSAFATQGKENLFERSYTGRVASVLINTDNNVKVQLQSYKEMREMPGYNNYRMVNVGILCSPTGKIIKVENSGEVVFLDRRDYRPTVSGSTNQTTGVYREGNQQLPRALERSIAVLHNRASELQRMISSTPAVKTTLEPKKVSALGGLVGTLGMESSQNCALFDFFIQLFLPRQERIGGIYTIEINEGRLYARDQESNEFTLDKDARVRSNINVSFNLNSEKPAWDQFPEFEGEEYIDPENYDLPVPKDWRLHELVILREGGHATVLYTPNQVQDYFEGKTFESSILLKQETQTEKNGLCVVSMKDCDEDSLKHANRQFSAVSTIKLPYSGASDSTFQPLSKWSMPSSFRGLPKTRELSTEPVPRTILERSFSIWPAVTESDPEVLLTVTKRSDDFAQKRAELLKSFNIYSRSKEETGLELEFQNRMMVLGLDNKNIVSFGQSNKSETSNPHNVYFAEA